MNDQNNVMLLFSLLANSPINLALHTREVGVYTRHALEDKGLREGETIFFVTIIINNIMQLQDL